MTSPQIERVDAIPMLIMWLQRMAVAEPIDHHWTPHREWDGLRYGQLAVIFLTFVLHERDHRRSALADWVAAHQATFMARTGWTITPADVTDDRLGHLLEVLGKDASQITAMQQAVRRHSVRVYALPTQIARVDTTSFNVTHAQAEGGQSDRALLQFGHSNDQRPDLRQCKQTLATLDPGGVPLLRATVAGNRADDPLSVPTWQDLVALLGHAHFLLVADGKAAALTTRATIAAGDGRALIPMPLTGEVPDLLRAWVLHPPVVPQPLVLPPTRNAPALTEALTLAGWRIYVTNSTPDDGSLVQATALYREEWTVKHGFHRWKGGYLPALPLFLHIAWRIRGLMLRLLIALQVRTLLEWQARRTLAAEQATVAGLVPGNPKMATAHPTAERLLTMFTSLHLFIHQVGDQRVGQVRESLTPLQQRILHLLQLPVTLYHFQARLSVPSVATGGCWSKMRNLCQHCRKVRYSPGKPR